MLLPLMPIAMRLPISIPNATCLHFATARTSARIWRQPNLPEVTRAQLGRVAQHGDRHRLLFSAAANLSEFGCSAELAWALLSESALDSGLPPSDVKRQIDCGLKHRSSVAQ